MFSPVRVVGGFPVAAMALALGIWGLSGWSALAQGGGVGGGAGAGIDGGLIGGGMGGPRGQDPVAGSGSGGPAYRAPGVPAGADGTPAGGAGYSNAVVVGYGPGYGSFGPGYPGYGLEYVHGCALREHQRHYPEKPSIRRWCSYVLGKECYYPYVADPYSDPAAGLGFWPPYSAPVASSIRRP